VKFLKKQANDNSYIWPAKDDQSMMIRGELVKSMMIRGELVKSMMIRGELVKFKEPRSEVVSKSRFKLVLILQQHSRREGDVLRRKLVQIASV